MSGVNSHVFTDIRETFFFISDNFFTKFALATHNCLDDCQFLQQSADWIMTRVKLTVQRLYKLSGERMVNAQATVRIYVGNQLMITEEISGMTESPVSKYLHHTEPSGSPLRVEWDCDGIADMTVCEIE